MKDVFKFHFLLLMIVSGDKLERATELVKLLSLEKSVMGAIKLVTVLKLPNLAERFNSILEVSNPYILVSVVSVEITKFIFALFLIFVCLVVTGETARRK